MASPNGNADLAAKPLGTRVRGGKNIYLYVYIIYII
jgi:hypothetical protein